MFKINLNVQKMGRAIALCCVQILLFSSLAFSSFGNTALAGPFTKEAESPPAEHTQKSVDLNQATNKADEASDKVFDSLNETQQFIGKTEKRNEGLAKARAHASEKWDNLADKAREAKDGNESLTPADRGMLEHVQGS